MLLWWRAVCIELISYSTFKNYFIIFGDKLLKNKLLVLLLCCSSSEISLKQSDISLIQGSRMEEKSPWFRMKSSNYRPLIGSKIMKYLSCIWDEISIQNVWIFHSKSGWSACYRRKTALQQHLGDEMWHSWAVKRGFEILKLRIYLGNKEVLNLRNWPEDFGWNHQIIGSKIMKYLMSFCALIFV